MAGEPAEDLPTRDDAEYDPATGRLSGTSCNWVSSATGTTANPVSWSASCYDPPETIDVNVHDVASKGARFEYKSGETFSQLFVPMSASITMTCVPYVAEDGEEPPFAI